MSIPKLRTDLARDGIFNVRDLGGLPTGSGKRVAIGRVLRADALQRVNGSAEELKSYGLKRVVDLRADSERELSGVLNIPGVEVLHEPVLDPTFLWVDKSELEPSDLLITRYREILGNFGSRLVGALNSVADLVSTEPEGAVAFHCAVGKDRTGLVAALLLSMLDVAPETIIDDYTRSSAVTAIQVQWLWSFGYLKEDVTDEDLSIGLWSARPDTMRSTLEWLSKEFGSAENYAIQNGMDSAAISGLRQHLLVD
ncbi:MAG TPA: tyrosine-protein phosphatase [Microthrixaceae bacterium]|nr:tyrosine-protein phosphatase [Microthrixaceae bacterium]